ncbi:hypothetical protein EI94DRAFT_1725834 [Lactarius quietus]|nr:hypothetical protein EI94DRAFT_1725834 [Lactarius quietus]
MSQNIPTNPSPSSSSDQASNFQAIFNTAVKAYEKKTKRDLLAHPLASQLQTCNSSASILAMLQGQVDDLDQAQGSDERLTKWLGPTVNVLLAFSDTLGEGISLVFSPGKVIFAGAGVLLQAAKDVIAAREALIDIFERIENFFKRLESYTSVRPSAGMTDIIVKIMVEVLNIFAIATKEIRQGRTKKYLKKLLGKTDIEDALKRLDKLTQDEVRMATAQLLVLTHDNGDAIRVVHDGNQWQEDLRKWFSSPDPSTNHIISCGAQHEGTAEWFFRGSIFDKWKINGSLLWIHGKRT